MRYVLVHGGTQGAWVWDLLTPELQALGHEAVAIDLPGHGQRVGELATVGGYRDAVLDVLEKGDVLVGHSLGGMAVTLAADVFSDLRHIAYVAAALPAEGQSVAEAMGAHQAEQARAEDPNSSRAENHLLFTEDGEHFTFSYEYVRDCMFQDCPSDVVDWAFERMTPQRTSVFMTEPISVPNFWASNPSRSYIVCADDRAFPAVVSSRFIERLGVDALSMPTSHMPQVSRPSELAAKLVAAVDTSARGGMSPT